MVARLRILVHHHHQIQINSVKTFNCSSSHTEVFTMKLSISLVLLASVTSTMAGCYSSGQSWIDDCNKNSFKGAVRDLCNNGQLSGFFQSPGTTKTWCVNSRCNGIRAELAVGWRGKGGWPLAAKDCIGRLYDEIDGCWTGGESTKSDWFVK